MQEIKKSEPRMLFYTVLNTGGIVVVTEKDEERTRSAPLFGLSKEERLKIFNSGAKELDKMEMGKYLTLKEK